jgi:hypothetical protein
MQQGQHGHAACTRRKGIKQGLVAWTCGMSMQHVLYMKHMLAACTYSIGMDVHRGYVECNCSNGMQLAHAAKTCIMYIQKEQHGVKQVQGAIGKSAQLIIFQ